MISMVHDAVRDEIGEDDYPPIPAGGRRMVIVYYPTGAFRAQHG